MEVKLKEIDYGDALSLEGVNGIQKVIDLQIERRDKIKELFQNNFDNLKYSKEVFDLYDIVFDEGYADIVNFMKAKKGIIFTNVPYNYDNAWMFLSYEIAYYELDLEHVYTIEEVIALAKVGKIILLSRKPYISTNYKDGYEGISNIKELTTIEEFNFEDTKENSLTNNYLVSNMIVSTFNYSEIRNSLSEVNTSLIEVLKGYKELCFELKTQYYGNSQKEYGEFDKIISVCDKEIKKLSKCK